MLIGRVCAMLLGLSALAAAADRREIQELQRDMALMQDQLRTTNDKLASLAVLVEQVLEKTTKNGTAVAVLEKELKEDLRAQEKSMAAPVTALGAKVDSMSDEFRQVRESVADLGGRIGKLQAQLTDLKSAVEVLAAPPPPPGGGAAAPPSAESLFSNARRDQSGGQMDLALAQYEDFLKTFPASDLAPDAQYNIGEILHTKGEFKAAAEAFDLVLEKYPENARTPDAMYMKGVSLVKAGDKRTALQVFRALVKKYPTGEHAERAKAQMKQLGPTAR